MKVLVIGSGGREHALAWRLAKSSSVEKVYATPGNPGIAQVATCVATGGRPEDFLRAADELAVDLTVVGPEAPLVAGVGDAFRAAGKPIVGCTREQAQLEGSKTFAKAFFDRVGIPTARFRSVESEDEGIQVLREFQYPVVVKADGLAAGKGVVIAAERNEAEQAIGSLGPKLVIEEFLEGDELSFIALCDGKSAIPLQPTQDHKRIFDGDQGPNTGGMGAYRDPRLLTSRQTQEILDTVILPTVARTRFSGFLYAGLMMTGGGPKVLEFNVRMGDPETQPLMHGLADDWGEILMSAAQGRLTQSSIRWSDGASVCVVMAAKGYPGEPEKGAIISGIASAEEFGATVFQAGTKLDNGQLSTAGGRVLGVTGSGAGLRNAIQTAYAAVDAIRFDGMQFRRDIGARGLRR